MKPGEAKQNMIYENITDGRRFTDPDGGEVLIYSRLDTCVIRQQSQLPSFKYCVEGEEIYRLKGREIRIGPGEMLFVNAGQTLDVVTSSNRETVGVCFYIDNPALRAAEIPYFRVAPGDHFVHHARTFHSNVSRGADSTEKVLRLGGQFSDGIVQTAVNVADTQKRLSLRRLHSRAELVDKLERARDHLGRNLNRSVTLDELSEVAGLSKFYLTRHFREAYDAPPIQYHQNARADCAANLMVRSSQNLEDIANSFGFCDYSSFFKAFKRRHGCTPGEYKRAMLDMAQSGLS